MWLRLGDLITILYETQSIFFNLKYKNMFALFPPPPFFFIYVDNEILTTHELFTDI